MPHLFRDDMELVDDFLFPFFIRSVQVPDGIVQLSHLFHKETNILLGGRGVGGIRHGIVIVERGMRSGKKYVKVMYMGEDFFSCACRFIRSNDKENA